MKKSNFDALMHRYVRGEVSEQERKKIEAWLSLMKAERTTELMLTDDDQERLFRKITNTLDGVDDVIALYPRRSPLRRFISNTWTQVAASVIILLSISFIIWSVVRPGWFAAMASTREKLILNDGTLVWLDHQSTFAYYEKEGSRHAELKGEALFEVAKIPNSLFIIRSGAIRVKVLGTSFSLKTSEDSVELKVLTGQVNLSSTEDTTGINVDMNESVVYTAKGETKRELLKPDEIPAIVVDTQYDMKFNNTRMEEVLARIEEKFEVHVIVNDKTLNACRVTVNMTDTSLDSSLVMITDLLDVTYERAENRIEFSGNGCK